MAMGVCAGAAIIIGMSQVRYIVGYRVPRKDSFHEQISVLIQGRAGFKWQVRLCSRCTAVLMLVTSLGGGFMLQRVCTSLQVSWHWCHGLSC